MKAFNERPWLQLKVLGLLLRLKFRSARGASRHPASMGDCQTISHTPHGPTYPVDEESEVRIQSIAWGQCSDLEPIRLVDEGNKM